MAPATGHAYNALGPGEQAPTNLRAHRTTCDRRKTRGLIGGVRRHNRWTRLCGARIVEVYWLQTRQSKPLLTQLSKRSRPMYRPAHAPEQFPQRQFWTDLLNQWLGLLQRYESDKSDVAYWHGERPLTGLLGAAGWMLPDGWSLEEFSTKRKSKSGKGTGRGDLWIGRGDYEATVEAKIYWVGGTISTARDDVLKRLNEAAVQLRAVNKKNRAGDPVSVCYVVPWYDAPEGKDRGVLAINELEIWARGESLATAKHFAASGVRTKSKGSEYPGVLLVARKETWNIPEKLQSHSAM